MTRRDSKTEIQAERFREEERDLIVVVVDKVFAIISILYRKIGKKGIKNGADGRVRTCDLLVTNELLYQLSYIGV